MKTLLLILVLAISSFGAEFYASTSGSGSTCSFVSPCSLHTALNNQARMGPGDTLYLRGGTYVGQWVSNLDGGTVKSYCAKFGPCLPLDPEWAVLDAYYTGTLSSGIDNSVTLIALTGSFQLQPGQVIRMGSEDIRIGDGTARNYSVSRGWNGSTPVRRAGGASFYLFGNLLSTYGSNTTYRDLELKNSNPTRAYSIAGYGGDLRGGEGNFDFCAGCSFINIVYHDNADGTFSSETATDSLYYGGLYLNNGSVSIARPNGLGLYVQNVCPSVKTIRHNIILNSFASGMKVYGAASGHADCVVLDGNISFNNGSPGYYSGSPTTHGGGALNRRFNNMEAGSDVHPSQNVTVTNSILFHYSGAFIELSGLVLGRAPTGGNRNLTATGNIVVEPGDLLTVDRFTGTTTVTGNTLVSNESGGGNFIVKLVNPTTARWDNNRYYGDTKVFSTCAGSLRAPFAFSGTTSNCGSTWLTFAQWKTASGWDAASKFTTSLPAANILDVDENAYEAGRNHIAYVNFTGASSFQFTPKGLANGRAYTIYDVQNWPTPYQSGVYSGGTITVKLSGSAAVKTPIGHVFTPATTQPEFAVFLLIPGQAAPGSQSRE